MPRSRLRYNKRVSLLTKQRTREHIIADLSVNHAEKAFLLAGYTSDRVFSDYGYDMIIRTFDGDGRLEPGYIAVQMKVSDTPEYGQSGDFITVRVDERDDAAWREDPFPVALILYDAAKEMAFYVHYQTLPRTTRRSVRIPTTNSFDVSAVNSVKRREEQKSKGLSTMIRRIDWLHYNELYAVITAHGFTAEPIANNGVLFRHPLGALLPFGYKDPQETVATYHYGAVRAAMDDYGIMTHDAFDLALSASGASRPRRTVSTSARRGLKDGWQTGKAARGVGKPRTVKAKASRTARQPVR